MSHSTCLAIRSGHAAYKSITHYTVTHPFIQKGLWSIFLAFLTLTIAHTPQRELEPHIYATPIHHIHTHFVYEYNTYYCTDVTCTLDIVDISQYDYRLFVCITAFVYCSTSLEWLTVTNVPPPTLYIPGCLTGVLAV